MRTHAQALSVHLLLSIALAGFVIVPLIATPAAADHERGRQVEIRGIVTAIGWYGRTFHVQARGGRFGGHTWTVVVDRHTDFDIRRRGRDHDVEADHDRPGRAFRQLAVGDLVEVEGRLIDWGTILAREVEVFRRGRPIGAPPIVVPPVITLPAPVISYPVDGSLVSRHEFLISGRTVRHAHVSIKASPVLWPVTLQTFDVQTDADYNGFFSAHVMPGRLFPRRGTHYQITVVAESQGIQSPPATLTVRAE